MNVWAVLIAGIGIGSLGMMLWGAVYDPNPHRAPRAMLPPSTARQVRRARRAALADLGDVDVGRACAPEREP